MKKWIQIACTAGVLCTPQLRAQWAVAVVAEPAHDIWWAATELPKWIQMIENTEEQIRKAQAMIDMVGHPKDLASSVLADVAPTLGATEGSAAMSTFDNVLDLTHAGWSLYHSAADLRRDVLAVPENYSVFGHDLVRNRDRYLKMATEKALRGRLQDAIEKKREVDKKEFAYQRTTLERLRSVETQSEMELLQANLTASKQRMDLADARVKQAESELQAFKGDSELEERRDVEMKKEEAEAALKGFIDRSTNATLVGGAPPADLTIRYRYFDHL